MKLTLQEMVVKATEVLKDFGVGQGLWFEIPDSANNAVLKLEKGYRPEAPVCLTTGAVARNDDHLVRNFLHYAASMEEMKAWLSDPGNAGEIAGSLQNLSDRVNRGFN